MTIKGPDCRSSEKGDKVRTCCYLDGEYVSTLRSGLTRTQLSMQRDLPTGVQGFIRGFPAGAGEGAAAHPLNPGQQTISAGRTYYLPQAIEPDTLTPEAASHAYIPGIARLRPIPVTEVHGNSCLNPL